jgi:hypothetical protein
MNYKWGDARVTYPDWKGTVQLDQIATRQTLNEITGIPDEWTIVGLDWGGGEVLDHAGKPRPRPHHMSAVVVPAGTDLTAAIEENGYLPVTMLALHDVDPYDVIRAMTHVVEFRMHIRRLDDVELQVIDEGDVPEQPR